MSNFEIYGDLYEFHPGYYVEEIMESLNISQAEMALRLGTTAKTVSMIVSGKAKISDEMAYKLSVVTGVSVDTWLNLQNEYNKKVIEIEARKLLDAQLEIMRCIDYQYFERVAHLEHTKSKYEQINNLCVFLHVLDLRILTRINQSVYFRQSTKHFTEKNIINAQAWIQTAVNFAHQMDSLLSFSADKLKSCLPQIRAMTLQSPELFLPELNRIFSSCGVAFVLLPKLRNSNINGAVKWLKNDRVVLALNDRRCYADIFWFALFHEIKHVLQQKLKTVFVSCNVPAKRDALEEEADLFAQNYLIPLKEYELFVNDKVFTVASIDSFASRIGVHPGIIIGRLQHDRYIRPYMYNDMRERYEISV